MLNEYELNPNPVDPNYTMKQNKTSPANEEITELLNGLIQTCKDGQEGFKQAAEATLIAELRSAFSGFAQQRTQFIGELQTLVISLGGNPENSGSILKMIRRGWLDLKSAITGTNEIAILEEAERSEDIAKQNYQQVLEKNLPPNIKKAVMEQLTGISNVHDSVKIMREAAKGANLLPPQIK